MENSPGALRVHSDGLDGSGPGADVSPYAAILWAIKSNGERSIPTILQPTQTPRMGAHIPPTGPIRPTLPAQLLSQATSATSPIRSRHRTRSEFPPKCARGLSPGQAGGSGQPPSETGIQGDSFVPPTEHDS